MKGSTNLIRNMGRVYSSGSQETIIKGIMLKMNEMDMERCISLMELSIRGIGQEDYSREKELSHFLMEL